MFGGGLFGLIMGELFVIMGQKDGLPDDLMSIPLGKISNCGTTALRKGNSRFTNKLRLFRSGRMRMDT